MKPYDYIIAGGGAAGLSLAWYLSQTTKSRARVLIIDKDKKQNNDRTWGFWHRNATPFDQIVSYQFENLDFFSRFYNRKISMDSHRYSVIRGIDFYNFIRSSLAAFPNFEFLTANIEKLNDQQNGATALTDHGTFSAGWIFTSIYNEKEILAAAKSALYLRQHFKGWVIETDEEVFGTDSFTMFDFRTPQQGAMRFFYVIPHSTKQALVEYTLFSEHLLPKADYDAAIKTYIDEVLKVKAYRIVDDEFGVIPMTNYYFPATQGKHIVQTGSAGGSSKPSSGYTFMRIQAHTQKVAAALAAGESPVIPAISPLRYRFYDAVLLNILKNDPEKAELLFSRMYQNNPVERLFDFLDEKGGLTNDLKVITSLPPWPFLKSTGQLLVQ
jgi:lycopene beta-cyclase